MQVTVTRDKDEARERDLEREKGGERDIHSSDRK
jgi:hypothetical protein